MCSVCSGDSFRVQRAQQWVELCLRCRSVSDTGSAACMSDRKKKKERPAGLFAAEGARAKWGRGAVSSGFQLG